jgi:ATP-dependent helicase/nuclease subunit A
MPSGPKYSWTGVSSLSNIWTKEQKEAIAGQGGNLLVSAAAGSGKTAVLVQRIIRRITDREHPVDADRLLVVTFTNASAAEMRERIGRALAREIEKDPGSKHLHRQLALLGRASISTIHSFCLELLRQYFYRLDLDPAFRVADENEAALIQAGAMDDLFEQRYGTEENRDFTALVECYGGRRDDSLLQELVLGAYHFARSTANPMAWLDSLPEKYRLEEGCSVDDLPWCGILKKALQNELELIISTLDQAVSLALKPGGPAAYLDNLREERDMFSCLRQQCLAGDGWQQLYGTFAAIVFTRLKSCKKEDAGQQLAEQVRKLRDTVKKKTAGMQKEYFRSTPEGICGDLKKLYPLAREMADLVRAFSEIYSKAKAAKSVVDFGDLEHYTLQVLSENSPQGLAPSPAAANLRERYEEVLVDEYQDINAVQEAILCLVSRQGEEKPNLFMVGDVKQSIYRFRLADPGLFLQKYITYPPAAGGRERRVELSRNFRSRCGLVDAVNFVFCQLMTPAVGELAYDTAAELVCGADYPPLPGELPRSVDAVEVHLIDKQELEQHAGQPDGDEGETPLDVPGGSELAEFEEDLDAAQKEARLIAAQIRELMAPAAGGPGMAVFDKELKTYRPLRCRDIVILLRATAGHANTFVEEFRQNDIPAYAELATGYFEATEVETVLSLLKIIDNPLQDIPLAAVLRSPLAGLDARDLAGIRLHSRRGYYYHAVVAASRAEQDDLSSKLCSFLEKLENWRTAARRGSLADLIWTIYRETGYYDYTGGLPGGGQRQANLRALYNRARQYDAGSFRGLFLFLRFVERVREGGRDLGAARALGEKEDVVRIMSIHKSKGLEFPVVFIAGLGRRFNFKDLNRDMLFHKDLGLGLQFVDPEARATYPSVSKLALRQKLKMEALAEEMRILYVAMTRAREKLVLVGSVRSLGSSARRWCGPAGDSGINLPDGYLAGAATYLDWLGAALARHRDGEKIRELGFCEEDPLETAAGDSSRWQVFLHAGLPRLDAAKPACPDLLAHIRKNKPLETAGPSYGAVQSRLSWIYPAAAAVGLASKVSVTELKRRLDRQEAEEDVALRGFRPPIGGRPRFMLEERGLTAAEKGSALHLVMQNIDLKCGLGAGDLQKEITAMVEREILTEEQAASIQVEKIAAFFAGPLGKRVLAGREVLRELPFTLALPAAEIYPGLLGCSGEEAVSQNVLDDQGKAGEITAGGTDKTIIPDLSCKQGSFSEMQTGKGEKVIIQDKVCSKSSGSEIQADRGERVIIQGIIDCLVDEGDGCLLLDYKTDVLAPDQLEKAIERYQVQLGFYARAVEEILGCHVKEKHLYLFHLDLALKCD